jgi:uncharacterized membrane protein
MLNYLAEWSALLLRWTHLITGIAWIGASFYFVWLDNHLQPPLQGEPVDPNVAGELWAVHGGGFYRSRKYRIAPAALPPTLHWFYWEAYSTWLSGFALLCLLYFWHADAFLLDPSVAALTAPAGVAIALVALVAGWLVYDGLCRSALGGRPVLLGGLIAALLSAEAWGLCHLFSGRGAFLLFGASLGTTMVANVFFVIIPGQRELVVAKREGREPDPAPGLRGKQRSVHNTYFTLPVLFAMLSNHYAMTTGARYNWLVLIAMSFAGACIRAWFVARHKPAAHGRWRRSLPAALGGVTLVGLVLALAPPAPGVGTDAVVDDRRAAQIVEARCAPCHAAVPRLAGLAAPPNGLIFETADQVRAHDSEVRQQLLTRAMPLGNLTGMTETERVQLLSWLNAGRRP